MVPILAPPQPIPQISLTTFVDFVLTSGTPRLTCVRKAKAMYDSAYQPPLDFYKQLRECIIQMHASGGSSVVLDRFITDNRNLKKDERYRNYSATYKRWMGRKQFDWMGCQTGKWESGDLSVRVNPELGIRINGTDHLVKLYFKQVQPSKMRLDTMLHLLRKTLPPRTNTIPAIMDVPRGKLIVPTVQIPGIDALLAGEAAAFVAMWRSV